MFVYRGQLADQFGPGHYELVTENLPILSTLRGWSHGFRSPFRSEVYFTSTRPVADLRWGTPSPMTVRDPDFTMVQVRANGLCVLRIADPEIFLREVIGTDSSVSTEEIAELLRRVIAQAFSDMVLETGARCDRPAGPADRAGRQAEELLRAIWCTAAAILAVGVGVGGWLLLAYGQSGDQARDQLEAIKTAGTIVVGAAARRRCCYRD